MVQPTLQEAEARGDKVALEECTFVVVSPEWEDSKSQDWHRLLDRLTINRVKLDPHEGSIFLSDDGKSLATPSDMHIVSHGLPNQSSGRKRSGPADGEMGQGKKPKLLGGKIGGVVWRAMRRRKDK